MKDFIVEPYKNWVYLEVKVDPSRVVLTERGFLILGTDDTPDEPVIVEKQT